jgi:hypothetical protein
MSHTSKFAALQSRRLVPELPVIATRESLNRALVFVAALNCLSMQPRVTRATKSCKDLGISARR